MFLCLFADPKTLTFVLHADGQLLHLQKNPIGQACHFHILWVHVIISLIALCASLFHTKKSLLAPGMSVQNLNVKYLSTSDYNLWVLLDFIVFIEFYLLCCVAE